MFNISTFDIYNFGAAPHTELSGYQPQESYSHKTFLSLFLLLLQTTVYSSEMKSDQDKIEFMLTNKVVGPELKILSL